MDFDSSAKFVASLAKFLQSLCNGYVDFDKGVEVIGHIHINVDSDLGKKVDYVLNERVCKNDNSITFISNSFPAQPAEKPQPPPKKPQEPDKTDEQDETGQIIPNSTNVGTIGPYRNTPGRGNAGDNTFNAGSKRPASPHQSRNLGSTGSPSFGRQSMSQSPRYQDSGGPSAKIGRTDIYSRSRGENYEGDGAYQEGGDEDDYSSNYGDSTEIDQKPVIDPDISIVKEEYMANQQGSSPYSGGNQTTGVGRGRGQPSSLVHHSVMNQGASNYANANFSHSQSEMFTSSSLEGAGDPSTLTRAQQEELEMYYRKGTDQHLTFLRNMREAHAMYPFTGKRDKELFEKALAELLRRLPILENVKIAAASYLHKTASTRRSVYKHRLNASQFKSPGQGLRGQQYGRQAYHGAHAYQGYGPGSYPGTPVHPGQQSQMGIERRISSIGSEDFQQGEESFDYQQLASDDSRDTQHSLSGDPSQSQGFHGAFGNGASQQPQPGGNFTADPGGVGGASDQQQGPPDIKLEAPPVPFMSTNEFELIEIDPDEEEDI